MIHHLQHIYCVGIHHLERGTCVTQIQQYHSTKYRRNIQTLLATFSREQIWWTTISIIMLVRKHGHLGGRDANRFNEKKKRIGSKL